MQSYNKNRQTILHKWNIDISEGRYAAIIVEIKNGFCVHLVFRLSERRQLHRFESWFNQKREEICERDVLRAHSIETGVAVMIR